MVARSVVVAAYPNSLEAGLAQGRLMQAGIQSEIDGLTSQSWLAGEVPLTGFQLVVAREQVEQARAVLFEKDDPADVAVDEQELEREAAATDEDEPLPPAGRAATRAPADAADTAAGAAWHSATRPAAALLLGILIWGMWTLGVALVWSFTLLRSPAGQALTPRARLLLIGIMLLGLLEIAAVLTLGWPFETAFERAEHSIWGWMGVDIAVAVGVLAIWSASRRAARR